MKSWQIKLEIQKCEVQMITNRSLIKKAEKDYESLTAFKSSVSSYQSEFAAGNAGKSQALDAVLAISKDCDAAARYHKGMKHLVVRNGGKIVDVLLEKLLHYAKKSMREKLEDISGWEESNRKLQRKIERLKKELEIAEMNEAFEDANK